MATEARLIAKCGLDCSICKAYVATQNNDLEAKKKVAAEWGDAEWPLTAKDICCDGCGTGKRLFGYCKMCPVFQCASARGVANCAHCAEYGCETLQKVWHDLSSGAKAQSNLDAIHAEL